MKKPVTVNLDSDQAERLAQLAAAQRVSVSYLSRLAFEFLLSNPAFFLPAAPRTTMNSAQTRDEIEVPA